jgi:hypothetical protein
MLNRHIFLYFDVNDTIFIGDTAKGVDRVTAIWKMLAERHEAVWDKNLPAMTFKDFVEKSLCPGNKRDQQVQQKHNEYYVNLIHYLEQLDNPELLQRVKQEFTQISNNLGENHIPQSFINLLNYLEENKLSYSLVFRTFGNDINDVVNELSKRTHVKALDHVTFIGGELKQANGNVLKSPEKILKYFKSGKYFTCSDNFADWRKTNETYAGGKPFVIDLNSRDVSIFFDDNAVSKQILCVKPVDDSYYDQSFIQQQLVQLGRIVPVNIFEACSNNDYFISRLEFALRTPLKLVTKGLQQLGTFAHKSAVELSEVYQKRFNH